MAEQIVFANMLACFYIFGACVCRLKLTSTDVWASVRSKYVVMGTGALQSALGHWIYPFSGGALLGAMIFTGTVCIAFYLSKKDWKDGVPESATKPGELYEARE